MDLEKELAELLNRYSKENDSDTPDYILAEYLLKCLWSFNIAVNLREKWYGREPRRNFEPGEPLDKVTAP